MAGWIKMPLGMEVGLGSGDCIRWGPTRLPPEKRGVAPPQFAAHARGGQTAGWTKMPLGMAVGHGPGDFVLGGDPAPSQRRAQSTQFAAHV